MQGPGQIFKEKNKENDSPYLEILFVSRDRIQKAFRPK